MKAYSLDLRKRIIETVEQGEGSVRQIASRFLVSVSFITRLLHRYRSTGSSEPKPHGGGHPSALGPEDMKRLRELVAKQPDATLEELRVRLGVPCSHMAICRALQKLGLRRKKKVFHAQERETVPKSSGSGGSSARTSRDWTGNGWFLSTRVELTRQ
jgi:transposase